MTPPASSSSLKLTRRRIVGTESRERRVGDVESRDGLMKLGNLV